MENRELCEKDCKPGNIPSCGCPLTNKGIPVDAILTGIWGLDCKRDKTDDQ